MKNLTTITAAAAANIVLTVVVVDILEHGHSGHIGVVIRDTGVRNGDDNVSDFDRRR